LLRQIVAGRAAALVRSRAGWTFGVDTMTDCAAFQQLATTTLADVLSRENIMDAGIRPLWPGIPRIAGPAYTVRCAPGDSLMLHAAIYRAAPGSVIVVQSGDTNYALAGGNVCAIAHNRGVAGFVIDGLIRDVTEVRQRGFPVFARGVIPIAAGKHTLGSLCAVIRCGGVTVSQNDIVVADEEGIVVVPAQQARAVVSTAQARATVDAAQSLERWEADHRRRIEAALERLGFRA
jgi:4-hydroxy-4-methyl-2-oxoglutarate aldolase